MLKIDAGKGAPDKVRAFIEIPKGSGVKYELDEETGLIKVDRILYTSMSYPYNYGFVPGTLGEDGDPLDIMVISATAFNSGTTVMVRPIGVLLMKDEEGVDTKVMAVPIDKVDPEMSSIKDVKDLNESVKTKIVHFYSYYKSVEPGKWVKLEGWESAAKAHEYINKAIERAKTH
jgi:inorganic pyrophosphatase